MTYDQLVAFLAVAGEGTFLHAASAALHIARGEQAPPPSRRNL